MNAWVGATSLVDISKGARNWELQVTVNKVYNSTRSVARQFFESHQRLTEKVMHPAGF